jgi:hypothetical protein
MKRIPLGLSGLVAIIVIGLMGFFLRPVCVPLSQDNLSSFSVPLKQRLEARDWYVKVWQEKKGQWYQCKTHLSRLMF